MNKFRNTWSMYAHANAVVVVMLTLLVPASRALAQQPSELEDMRREIRQLRSQVQQLRSAMSEAADLEYQKAGALSRALKAIPASGDSSSPKARDDGNDRGRNAAMPPVVEPAAPVAVAAPALPTGRNSRRGGEGARKAASEPPPAGMVRGKVVVSKSEPVSYVYVENVPAPPVKDQRHVIEQIGKRFVPAWAVIQRGTVISFPNRDNIYHNVFSRSSGNSFDLGLYPAGESKTHTFNEPGEVEIYCNIHPQMAASTLVVPNRLFAKVKADGTFEIGGVPSGKRKLVAWAPGSRLAAAWVDVVPGEAAQVELKLEPKASSHLNKAGQQYGSYE